MKTNSENIFEKGNLRSHFTCCGSLEKQDGSASLSVAFYRGKMGTVGAVAVDKEGNVACATSTGGMLNKMEGRVGDTPCIGQFSTLFSTLN